MIVHLRFSHKYILLMMTLLTLKVSVFAQSETLSTGSFIINMGATNPNTIANGLKPYGLIYDLLRNNNVPVKLLAVKVELPQLSTTVTVGALGNVFGTAVLLPAELVHPLTV